ncbi:MAG: peptidylprolyl isomerase [Vulcanococcus sp.]|jgi:parvulin-like peptidyl-prolyl isomerase
MTQSSPALPFSADGVRWLADRQLLRPALRADLMLRTLATVPLTEEEQTQALSSFAQQQGIGDSDALNAHRARQGLTIAALHQLAEQPLRLQRYCADVFSPKAETRFLDRKTALDRVVYSLLRLPEAGLARELYLRIADGEADFAELAQQYSQGPERQTRGVVGPVPITQAHPALVRRLRSNPPGSLLEPFRIESWWVVVRIESYAPANFDDQTRDAMTRELFEAWLEEEVDKQLSALSDVLEP